MDDVKSLRHAGWAGIVGVLLLAASFIAANWTDPATGDAALRADIADAEGQAYLAYTMLAPAVALLFWFATGLRRFLLIRCRADRLAAAVVPGIAFFTALFSAGIALILASTFASTWTDEFRIDPNLFRALAVGGIALAFLGLVGGGVVAAATSRAAEVAGVIPRWQAWVGYVVAFVAVFGMWTFGAALIPFALWLLAAAVALIRTSGSPAGTTPAADQGGVPAQAAGTVEQPRRAEPAQ
ncbi:MAG: hypothetical protein ACRDWY_17925 [Actinomycetes bacterium]